MNGIKKNRIKSPEDKNVPLVSVIIPAYNASRYIAKAVESVFVQEFKDYEVIVINDGSPDTSDFEREIEPFRDRITYLKQENRGPGAARNRGILAAQGTIVAFLDADDYWRPNFLAEQMEFLETEGFDLVYADGELVGESTLAGRTFMESVPSDGEVTFENLLATRCTVLLSTVLARRQSLIDAGLFDESFSHAEDFDLWLRLAGRGARLGYQRKLLLWRREHSASLCADVSRQLKGALRILEKAEANGGLSPSEQAALVSTRNKLKADLRLEHAKRSLSRGDFKAAAEAVEDANQFYRSSKLRVVLLSLRFWPSLLLRMYKLRRSNLESKEAVSLWTN